MTKKKRTSNALGGMSLKFPEGPQLTHTQDNMWKVSEVEVEHKRNALCTSMVAMPLLLIGSPAQVVAQTLDISVEACLSITLGPKLYCRAHNRKCTASALKDSSRQICYIHRQYLNFMTIQVNANCLAPFLAHGWRR